MAFWALGAFDKMKNITEKLNIKDVSKKVISYVVSVSLSRPSRVIIDKNQISHKEEAFNRMMSLK
jgi:hypothetical protein